MGKKLFLLALEFLAITVTLTWLWVGWGHVVYQRFLVAATAPLFAWLGAPGLGFGPVPHRFVNFVPFLALMAVTPGLSPRRRLVGTLVGLGVIVLSHVAFMLASASETLGLGSLPRPFSALLLAVVLLDSLPFVLWALIANALLRRLAGRVLRRT